MSDFDDSPHWQEPWYIIDKLRAENERLNDKFPCGHRKIDWDDSYGGCSACVTIQMAHDYDSLPLDIVQCHDKIEELENYKTLHEGRAKHGDDSCPYCRQEDKVERLKQFIHEVVVWVPGGGHTLGCNCGAFWCERRKDALEAK